MELIPGANYGMVLAEIGCLDESDRVGQSGEWTIAPGFLDTIEE